MHLFLLFLYVCSFITYLLHIIIQNNFCAYYVILRPYFSRHLTLSNTPKQALAVNSENVDREADDLNNDERALNFSFVVMVDNGGKAGIHLFFLHA